jgi:hypothetical protein
MLKEKVNSHVVNTAQLGLDKLRAIDPELDLGNGLTLQSLDTTVQEIRSAIAQYNTAAAELVKMDRARQNQEKVLRANINRIVMGVGAKYGEKSSEYKAVQKLWQLTKRSSAPAPSDAAPVPSGVAKNGAKESAIEVPTEVLERVPAIVA